VVETIEKALALFANGPMTVHTAAQRLGMHLVADELEVTFTPRNRLFSRGSAVRQFDKETLGSLILDVDDHATVKYGPLRAAFGPFKMATRQHPGDEAEFIAFPKIGQSNVACIMSVTMRKFTEQPTDEDAVGRIEISR
jgi:hypothetical protein